MPRAPHGCRDVTLRAGTSPDSHCYRRLRLMRSRVAVSAAQGVETGVGERVIAEGRVLVTGRKLRDLNIYTFKGTVQISGFVDNQEQLNRALELARSQKGVKAVVNKMQVKPASSS